MTDKQHAADQELMSRARNHLPQPAPRWLLVDVAQQRLLLMSGDQVQAQYPVSTARAGLDATENSGGTPPGRHRILQKLGEDMPPGTVFESRRPTGQVWRPDDQDVTRHSSRPLRAAADLILSRILVLEGQEEGINRGPGCDTRARFIYIHGTNHEDVIGQPCSHGCVRLTNPDVIDLFARVEEGDPVVIV